MHKQPFRSRAAVVTAGAVIVVLGAGGTAVATGQVTSEDIKDHTIQAVDLMTGSVDSRAIQDDSVHSSDLHDGGVKPQDLSSGVRAQLARNRYISSLGGDFTATNGSVTLTPDGVAFGPYADGGQAGGSLEFTGLNGMKLSDLKNLVYYARYTATGDSGGVGVPYLRVFLDGDNHDAIFSPNTQSPDADIAEGPFHEWVATSGSWRYDDDGGTGQDESYSALLAAHGDDTISGIYISTGFSNGQNLSSLLRWMQVNGVTYSFGA